MGHIISASNLNISATLEQICPCEIINANCYGLIVLLLLLVQYIMWFKIGAQLSPPFSTFWVQVSWTCSCIDWRQNAVIVWNFVFNSGEWVVFSTVVSEHVKEHDSMTSLVLHEDFFLFSQHFKLIIPLLCSFELQFIW